MNYILSPHDQGTPEWLQDRAGRVTGSMASALYAKIKTGEAAARADYRTSLAIERLSGMPEEQGYISPEMAWGTAQEPFARMAFESETGISVVESGFAYSPDIMVGCSVDGFIRGDTLGLIESKSPKTKTHIRYMMEKRVPPAYIPQITHNCWVTGAEFAHFISFDPRIVGLELFHVEIKAKDLAIEEHEKIVMEFLTEVDTLVQKLNEMKGK